MTLGSSQFLDSTFRPLPLTSTNIIIVIILGIMFKSYENIFALYSSNHQGFGGGAGDQT